MQIFLEKIPSAIQKDVKSISRALCDLYIQEWNEKFDVFSKRKRFLLFKDNICFDKYLTKISKFYYDKIIKFRTGNHRLPIETGRLDDTPLNERNVTFAIKTT